MLCLEQDVLTVVQIFLYFIKHEVEELVVTLEDAGH